jgi:hypothetical protein
VRRRTLIAVVSVLAALAIAPAARADGDPASDVLLQQDVFFPYAPDTAPRLSGALTGLLVRTRQAGYPMKVALIGSANDLGGNTELFGRPRAYANLLADELRTLRHGQPKTEPLHLLVVMPAGFSGAGLGDGAGQALNEIPINAAAQSDGLAQAAIKAVAKLATLNGHATPTPPEAALALAPRHESTQRPGSSVLPFVLPLVLIVAVLLVGGRVAARRQQRA